MRHTEDDEESVVKDYKVKDVSGQYIQRKHIGDDFMIKEGERLKEKRLKRERMERVKRVVKAQASKRSIID